MQQFVTQKKSHSKMCSLSNLPAPGGHKHEFKREFGVEITSMAVNQGFLPSELPSNQDLRKQYQRCMVAYGNSAAANNTVQRRLPQHKEVSTLDDQENNSIILNTLMDVDLPTASVSVSDHHSQIDFVCGARGMPRFKRSLSDCTDISMLSSTTVQEETDADTRAYSEEDCDMNMEQTVSTTSVNVTTVTSTAMPMPVSIPAVSVVVVPRPKKYVANEVYARMHDLFHMERSSQESGEAFVHRLAATLNGGADVWAKLVNFMVGFHYEFNLQPNTLHVAMQYVSHYLVNKKSFRLDYLNLLGAVALYVACKFEDGFPINIDRILKHCARSDWSERDILNMEIDICGTLDWDLHHTTRLQYALECLKLLGINVDCDVSEKYRDMKETAYRRKEGLLTTADEELQSDTLRRLGFMTRYVTEISLYEYSLSMHQNSVLGVAAVYTASYLCGFAVTRDMEMALGCDSTSLRVMCARLIQLARASHNSAVPPFNGNNLTYCKFSKSLFGEVSKLPLIRTDVTIH